MILCVAGDAVFGQFDSLTDNDILVQKPNPYSFILTMINRGIAGFVEAGSLDMPKSQKLHAVNPPMAKEIAEKFGWGPGGVPASANAKL